MKYWRIHDWLGILIIVTSKVLALVIIKCCDQSCVGVLGSVVGEIVKGLDEGCVEGDRIQGYSSPELALLEGLQVKAGDNAKIVPATTKGKIQIGVRESIDIHNFAICKNNLTPFNHILFAIAMDLPHSF